MGSFDDNREKNLNRFTKLSLPYVQLKLEAAGGTLGLLFYQSCFTVFVNNNNNDNIIV